jgi:dTDP-glucose 4,6-dehydratase
MISHALAGKDLPVYGQGTNVRDWIHVEDHCAGIDLVLRKGRPGETYCLGGRAERQNIVIVELLCSILEELRPKSGTGKPAHYRDQIRFVTDRLGHDLRYAIDDSKAEKELGFSRKWSFETGLRETVRWYLERL